MTTRLVNLTPHAVRVLDDHGAVIADIPPTAPPARRAEHLRLEGLLDDTIPLARLTFGPVENLPEPADGTWYIVSRPVADACPERDDLLVPARLVRDQHGNPTGCLALARGTATP